MSTLCLSLAETLRCVGVTRVEAIALIVPPAVEVIFSVILVILRWNKGGLHWFLVAEGWSFLLLAITDVVIHLVPALHNSLQLFKIVDLVIGGASLIPLFFYTLFLFLYSRRHINTSLSARVRWVINITLGALVLPLLLLNELSSLFGISYRLGRVPGNPNSVPLVGFANRRDEITWTFLSSFTIALLAAYQAILFFLSFFQIARAFIQDHNRSRKDFYDTAIDEKALDSLRGLGWFAAGLKIGAVEAIVAFAGIGFAPAFSRRLMRVVARAFLILGIIRGADEPPAGFVNLAHEKSTARSKSSRQNTSVRGMISDPRFSTFQHLSPDNLPPGPMGGIQTGGGVFMPQSSLRISDRRRRSVRFNQDNTLLGRRVTVRSGQGKEAPKLEVRFSDLNMPSPDTIADQAEYRSALSAIPEGSSYTPSVFSDPRPALPPMPMPPPQAARASSDYHSSRAYTRGSKVSVTSDSLDAVRELTRKFPGIPPRVTGKYRGSILGQPMEPEAQLELDRKRFASGDAGEYYAMDASYALGAAGPSNSRRKPAPPASPNLVDSYYGRQIDRSEFIAQGVPTVRDSGAYDNRHHHDAVRHSHLDHMRNYFPATPMSAAAYAQASNRGSTSEAHEYGGPLTLTQAQAYAYQVDPRSQNPSSYGADGDVSSSVSTNSRPDSETYAYLNERSPSLTTPRQMGRLAQRAQADRERMEEAERSLEYERGQLVAQYQQQYLQAPPRGRGQKGESTQTLQVPWAPSDMEMNIAGARADLDRAWSSVPGGRVPTTDEERPSSPSPSSSGSSKKTGANLKDIGAAKQTPTPESAMGHRAKVASLALSAFEVRDYPSLSEVVPRHMYPQRSEVDQRN